MPNFKYNGISHFTFITLPQYRQQGNYEKTCYRNSLVCVGKS